MTMKSENVCSTRAALSPEQLALLLDHEINIRRLKKSQNVCFQRSTTTTPLSTHNNHDGIFYTPIYYTHHYGTLRRHHTTMRLSIYEDSIFIYSIYTMMVLATLSLFYSIFLRYIIINDGTAILIRSGSVLQSPINSLPPLLVRYAISIHHNS